MTYSGTATVLYRAWDQTQGAAGDLFDTTGKIGGRNSLGTATETATSTVGSG